MLLPILSFPFLFLRFFKFVQYQYFRRAALLQRRSAVAFKYYDQGGDSHLEDNDPVEEYLNSCSVAVCTHRYIAVSAQ